MGVKSAVAARIRGWDFYCYDYKMFPLHNDCRLCISYGKLNVGGFVKTKYFCAWAVKKVNKILSYCDKLWMKMNRK